MEEPITPSLEKRIAAIEDHLAILNLLASHPPSADTGSEEILRAIYAEDASFDRGEGLHGAMGIDKIVNFAQSRAHHIAIEGGLAHFSNLPLVELHGNTAVATSYIMIITPDSIGEERELSNHGVSKGYRIHRVVANRWGLERIGTEWRIKSRRVYPLDGSEPARALLAQVASIYVGVQPNNPPRAK